jgi:hypothetical protein
MGGLESTIFLRALFGPSPPPLSVSKLISSVMQRKMDLNVIRVGIELFTNLDTAEMAAAVATTAELFGAVGLGIGRIQQFGISLEQANGHADIDGFLEASALTETFGTRNRAIDVFFVRTFAGPTVGRSPVGGSCKGLDDINSGVVVAIEHAAAITGNTLAHELAHYLGLGHKTQRDNLMFESVPNGQQLTLEQGEKMKRHCLVYTDCRQH